MSRHYLMLRMASSRDLSALGEESAWPRSRYYSTPSDPRLLQAPPLTVASNRQPSLRRAASAAVRSADDVAALSAAWTARAWRPFTRVGVADSSNAVAAPLSCEKSGASGSLQTLESREDDEDDSAFAEEPPPGSENDSADGGVRLSKEMMFAVAAAVVLLTSGGLILGFGPVYAALVREGQWAELCRDGPGERHGLQAQAQAPCASQEIHLQYVFSTSFLCLSAANACFGVFLDVFGPRLTALLGLALSVAGNFALAYSDSGAGTGAWIIGGYAMVGAGGMGSFLAAFQILQLYRVQGVVCSTLSSLFNCSGYIYMALEIDTVTRRVFFQVYGVVVAVCMATCFLVFPTNCITRPGDSLAIPGLRLEKPRIHTPTGLVDGMKQQLKRGDLWYFAVFFGWISLIFAFAGGAIPSMLAGLAGDDAGAAAAYTSILYPVIVNGTFVYSPLVGYVIDRFGFKAIFFACLALVQLFITLLLVPSLRVQLLMFVVYSMAQACLYALQFAYIMMCFPAELNGTLQAFLATMSFSFGLLNYLLNPWAQVNLHGDYTVVLLVLALPTLLLYVFIDVVHGCEDKIVLDGDDDGGEAHPLI
ncbi:hypothetical protein PybrP1_012807 [[Pythium] brassicae (nom. inval.)]|nr:hypothetical protein PybrP1_012807 [[Pythium] brassicae (nom. inval.)]